MSTFNAEQYWESRLQQHYDLVGVGDISLSAAYNKWSYKVTRRILLRLCKKYSEGKANKAVLDIGSGTGFVVNVWKELGKQVTGVDISTTAVENLSRQFANDKFIRCDVGSETLPLSQNSISVCTAASVLYHLVDDEALNNALKNIHEALEPEGTFIFSENFIHQKTFLTTHQKCRTLEEYEAALKASGFKIIDRVANYVLMNEPMDAKSKTVPRIWNALTSFSKKSKLLDSLIWPLLYPIELLLTRLMKESPAQEFMICKALK